MVASVTRHPITVVGAGIVGLWQALVLARAGHPVRLVERSAEPFALSASLYAGAMLAPDCEAESAAPVIRTLGFEALEHWRRTYPPLVEKGSLVVAPARDRAELARFARMTIGHELADPDRIAALEPDLGGRFVSGLHFPKEAHLDPRAAMGFLLDAARAAGAEVRFGYDWQGGEGTIVDCRGLAAQADLPTLRGVRGERLIVHTREVALTRPIRLLHPRFPLYVVPLGDGRYMVGASVIESEDAGPVTVRSALELLGAAYTLHTAFGEAQIVEMGAGIRPAFADNVPRIVVRGRHIYVNGLYRHGFLLAPALAALVAEHIETGASNAEVFACASS